MKWAKLLYCYIPLPKKEREIYLDRVRSLVEKYKPIIEEEMGIDLGEVDVKEYRHLIKDRIEMFKRVGFLDDDLEFNKTNLFILAPRGEKAVDKTIEFIKKAEPLLSGHVGEAFVRFLSHGQYLEFLKNGFMDALENPWHPEAPKEDETLSNALISLHEFFASTVHSKRVKRGLKSFNRFLHM